MTTFRPFSNGTEHLDWCVANCELCAKSYDHEARDWRCDLERAIDEGNCIDGTIPMAIAERIGVVAEPFPHLGPCKEKQ